MTMWPTVTFGPTATGCEEEAIGGKKGSVGGQSMFADHVDDGTPTTGTPSPPRSLFHLFSAASADRYPTRSPEKHTDRSRMRGGMRATRWQYHLSSLLSYYLFSALLLGANRSGTASRGRKRRRRCTRPCCSCGGGGGNAAQRQWKRIAKAR